MGKYGLAFDVVETDKELRQLREFMRTQPGTYDPVTHEQWLEEVCIPGIATGERTALVWFQDGKIVGDAVLKIVSEQASTIEIKNFRKLPFVTMSGRTIRSAGDFMMIQALDEAREMLGEKTSTEADKATVILDVTLGNPVVTFFERHGFNETGRDQLYTPGQTEILMARELQLT